MKRYEQTAHFLGYENVNQERRPRTVIQLINDKTDYVLLLLEVRCLAAEIYI